MSRIKEFYHEQIVEGMGRVITEPHIFKYFVHFKYMGEAINIFADDQKRILELAKQAVPEINGVKMSEKSDEFEFLTPHMNIPFLLFEITNPIY